MKSTQNLPIFLILVLLHILYKVLKQRIIQGQNLLKLQQLNNCQNLIFSLNLFQYIYNSYDNIRLNEQQLMQPQIIQPVETKISLNNQDLQQKHNIIEQLLTLSNTQLEKQAELFKQWPNEQLKTIIQQHSKSPEAVSICRKKQNARYYGQTCNEMAHGYGLLIYQGTSGIRFYQGQFQNNCKHGSGFQYIEGDIYTGKYINNKPQDVNGVFIWKNGDTFVGSFVNGMKHGNGKWVSGNDLYVGQWKFNKPDGQGKIKTSTSQYEGSVKNGYKHGQGTQFFSNGDRYNGFYANGRPEGQGTYYWNNGALYKGQFKNGLRYGFGSWQYGSQRYEGYYVNDKRNGHGLYSWQGGSFYKGQFQDDLRHGYGEMHWNQNSYYIGEWKQGIQDGEGEYYENDHLIKKGLYIKGKFVQPHPEQQSIEPQQKKKSPKPNRRYPAIHKKSPSKQSKQATKSHNQSYHISSNTNTNTDLISRRKSLGGAKITHYIKKEAEFSQTNNQSKKQIHVPKSFLKAKQKSPKNSFSYGQEYMKKNNKSYSTKQKANQIENFSQTHLSPIKWNNFKHIRDQQVYNIGAKLPNIH